MCAPVKGYITNDAVSNVHGLAFAEHFSVLVPELLFLIES